MNTVQSQFVPPDSVVCDMIKVSEARVEMMEQAITELNSRNDDLQSEVCTMLKTSQRPPFK